MARNKAAPNDDMHTSFTTLTHTLVAALDLLSTSISSPSHHHPLSYLSGASPSAQISPAFSLARDDREPKHPKKDESSEPRPRGFNQLVMFQEVRASEGRVYWMSTCC